MRYAFFLSLLILGTACSNQELAQNLQLPEFVSVTGPPSPSTDVDFKQTTATIDVHGWTNSEVFLRYALNEEDLRSVQATEVTDVCEENGSIRQCSFTFPNGNQQAEIVFPDNATLYYLWIVEYRLPEGEDAAYVEAEVGTCQIDAPQSCSYDDDCASGMVCRRDERRADPETTLAPLVCLRPPPAG